MFKALCLASLLSSASLHAAVREASWSLLEPDPVYPGQRIQILLNLDTDANEELGNITFNPTPFENQPIQVGQGQPLTRQKLKDADGNTYDRLRILFPAEPAAAGKIELPAITLTGTRTVLMQDAIGFPLSRRERFNAEIKPFSFTAAPLPEAGKPTGFTGAVGRYAFTGKADPVKLAPGSVVTVTLTLEAQNGILPEGFIPQPAPDPALFRAYETKTVTRSEKRIVTETLLVPLSEGAAAIGSNTFSWFDPFARRYMTARAALPALTVAKQTETAQPALKIIDTSPVSAPPEGEGLGLKENSLLRFGPSERSPVLHRLPAGEHVAPLERAEGWVRVDAAGRRGWLKDFQMDSGGL